MHFNRKSVICISIILFILCMVIPLVIASYFSWLHAKEIESDRLYSNVKNVVQRSRICLNEVYQTMDQLLSIKHAACTSNDIRQMQDIVFSKRCIYEIEYVNHDMVWCSSAGKVAGNIRVSPEGFVMPNGVTISSDVSNFLRQGNHFIRFKQGNYVVSVDKNSLTDIMTEPYMQIAIVTDSGEVISTLNYSNINTTLIEAVLKDYNLKEADDSLLAVYRAPGLYYIVSEPNSYVFKQWRKNLLLLLPFGFVMSLIACGSVIWALRRRLSDLGELRIAIARREITVYYQPIIEFSTGICIGAEALVRWKKSDGTLVNQDLFISLAENSGLIREITDQVIESVVKNLKNILIDNRNLHISINVSTLDFNSKRIFQVLGDALEDTGIESQQIWLEITERGFIDFESARESIDDASKLGYVIVIDDFGTGYSSLSYLKELHIDVLKIDKSFINSLNTDSVTSNVTDIIIKLAKELNLKVVAEGVETVAQANYLKELHVDFAQGWLYAKAMPLEEFIIFYQNNRYAK